MSLEVVHAELPYRVTEVRVARHSCAHLLGNSDRRRQWMKCDRVNVQVGVVLHVGALPLPCQPPNAEIMRKSDTSIQKFDLPGG